MGAQILLLLEDQKAVGDHIVQCLHDDISVFSYSSSEDYSSNLCWADEDHKEEEESNGDERIQFWESQEALLQEILEHHSSTGWKFRQEILRIIETARERNLSCRCANPKSSGGCCKCLRQVVVNLLSSNGFSANLCTSRWSHTPKLPGGTHEYIEVMASTPSRKKQVPLLIEMAFRDEFKMAKACDEYHRLTNQLPEVYVGKAEHLNAIIRIVCDAAQRSTTEKRIHMGPWRKRSFMQKKWSGPSQLLSQSQSSSSSSSSFPELALALSTQQVHMTAVSTRLRFPASTALKVV